MKETLNIKAELYEIQVWLMWLLALALYETDHIILFFIVLSHSIFTVINTLIIHIKQMVKDKEI